MNARRFVALQVSGILPFLSGMVEIVRNGNFFRGPYQFVSDYQTYKKLHKQGQNFPLSWRDMYPRYFDRYEAAGIVPKHYFLMDIWAAKKVYDSKVKQHFDVGSRLDGFIAHCLVFCKVVMLDIRELPYKIDGLSFVVADCSNMSDIKSSSIPSISSLHALEHFGLGRYGDPIDPDQFRKAMREIQRVAKKGGDIYIAVPIGRQRLEFNAHRIFAPETVTRIFSECRLVEFSAINDQDELILNADITAFDQAHYSCGMFHFKKKI